MGQQNNNHRSCLTFHASTAGQAQAVTSGACSQGRVLPPCLHPTFESSIRSASTATKPRSSSSSRSAPSNRMRLPRWWGPSPASGLPRSSGTTAAFGPSSPGGAEGSCRCCLPFFGCFTVDFLPRGGDGGGEADSSSEWDKSKSQSVGLISGAYQWGMLVSCDRDGSNLGKPDTNMKQAGCALHT